MINVNNRFTMARIVQCAMALTWPFLLTFYHCAFGQQAASIGAQQRKSEPNVAATVCVPSYAGSAYFPVDSWVYPAVLRLYSMGYIDNLYLDMRPWTRGSVGHMLEEISAQIEDANEYRVSTVGEAKSIFDELSYFLHYNDRMQCRTDHGNLNIESTYSVFRGLSGTPLRDSYHLGSTVINDYGRRYASGLNNYSGASAYASAGPLLLYARGEFQGEPSTAPYSLALANQLSGIDGTTDYFNPTCWLSGASCTPIPYGEQATMPAAPRAVGLDGRVLEAYVSAQVLNHVISFGKQDEWLGPGMGGAMAYSNNAENVYAFHIDRIEPLHVPLLSRLTGPFRYEFLVGSLKGHIYPIDPWVHVEKVSFRPTQNLELGFERTVIWGGKGHEPINIKSFLRSFFSTYSPTNMVGAFPVKDSNQDPGARFAAFDFSYRLPFVRNWLTLYSDSEVHDDVSPADAPRRASWRPGIYLSHVPWVPKLDLRVEGVSTDPPVSTSQHGTFMYFEAIQRQGYTNNGQLFGDWLGREDKGGQAWLTWHLSGNEWVQASMRHQKADKDFIPGGTTLDDVSVQVVKRFGKDWELNGSFTHETWKAPIYVTGQQTVTNTTVQLTWFPQRKVTF
jgi:hypothetical protein